ncbi:MAG TPA: 30S ribosomal protein S17 [Anaerolineales bacterium]|nr:30S ribosomal protein S17 [Anaerolineales bacterium]
MRNKRRRMTGEVKQAKMEKTIRVQVDQSYRHPLYQKVIRKSRQYLVHDEIGCRPGDQVLIVESRPISKLKRWSVESILTPATEEEVAASVQELVDDGLPEAEE